MTVAVILATAMTYEVGKTYHASVADLQGESMEQPIHILREATYAEWVAYAKEVAPMISEAALLRTHHEHPHFYEVATD